MNKGQYVFGQLMQTLPRREFDQCVKRYGGNHRVRGMTFWIQFLKMSFGQITHRESLRDTVTCLQAHANKLYHLGFKHPVFRSTLADANENRDWRVYADFAQVLIARARQLYRDDNDFSLEIGGPVYALDATTIDLCLSVFWWAPFRRGGNLSSGQKQRIAIARALLKTKAKIFIFDEITSALDEDAADNLVDSIKERLSGKTVFFMTHNAGLANKMDSKISI